MFPLPHRPDDIINALANRIHLIPITANPDILSIWSTSYKHSELGYPLPAKSTYHPGHVGNDKRSRKRDSREGGMGID